EYKKMGDTLGGIIQITIKNVPVGLGSFVNWDRKLDSKLAQSVMSVPAIKSVEFGLGRDYAKISGNNSHDEIFWENDRYFHKTNNSGGIEGGMSNGEDIVVTAAMKPIPTMKKPLNSVEIKTHLPQKAHFERSDACAVEACGVVLRNVCAIVILDAFLEKFTSDTKEDIDICYEQYKKRIKKL
ncbi:chorismate synthase, partial [bacterium]|nr:chorismate synthase [bacterium]